MFRVLGQDVALPVQSAVCMNILWLAIDSHDIPLMGDITKAPRYPGQIKTQSPETCNSSLRSCRPQGTAEMSTDLNQAVRLLGL